MSPPPPGGDEDERPAPGRLTGEAASGESAPHRLGRRAAKNTVARAVAEVLAKLSSLAVLVVLARTLGATELGVYVFATAFGTLIASAVGLGFDTYLLREVAGDRRALERLFFNVVALKLLLAIPVCAAGLGALLVLGYDEHTRVTTCVLFVGILLEVIGRTLESAFNSHERGDLLSISMVAGRATGSALGILALVTGHGIVTVAAGYSLGAAVYLAVAATLFHSAIGLPRIAVERRAWWPLVSRSTPFAMQDVGNAALFRLDAVLLSLMATAAAVGRYGACYRVLESTMFISSALLGAFSAMYVYLSPRTRPSLAAVFQGSLKLAVVLLLPLAVVLELRPEPVLRLLFGAQFVGAADVLRLLAPAIVLLGVWALAVTLVISRTRPGAVVRLTGAMVALNAIANVVLIPPFEDAGAAAAMLLTEIVFAVLILRRAARAVGGLDWVSTFTGPAAAGVAMTVPLFMNDGLVLPTAAALLVYAATLACVERIVAPGDVRLATAVLRRRAALPSSR